MFCHPCCWCPNCYFYPSANSKVVLVMPQSPCEQIVRDKHLTDCNSQGVATNCQMLSSVCHFFGCWMSFAWVPEVFKDSSQICRSCKDLDLGIWYQFQSVTWTRNVNFNSSLESKNQVFPLWWFSLRKEYMKWQNWATWIPVMPFLAYLHLDLGMVRSFDTKRDQEMHLQVSISCAFDELHGNWTANAQQLVYVVVVLGGGKTYRNYMICCESEDIISKPIWNASKVPLAVFLDSWWQLAGHLHMCCRKC